jgi:hypothetical protein
MEIAKKNTINLKIKTSRKKYSLKTKIMAQKITWKRLKNKVGFQR